MSNIFTRSTNHMLTQVQLSLLWILGRNCKISYIDVGASSFEKPSFGRAFGQISSFGFEPDARSGDDFADAKKVGKFELFPVGLSDVEGDCPLFLTRKSHCSSLMEPNDSDDPRYKVVDVASIPCIKLDSLGLSADVIKIDVQGAEKKVIGGGLVTIKKATILECELFISNTYKDQTTLTDLLELLNPLGFVLLDICGIYRNSSRFGRIEFTDLIFVNENLLIDYKVNFYVLVAHAIERNYIGRIDLNSSLYRFSIAQRLVFQAIVVTNIFKTNPSLKLKG